MIKEDTLKIAFDFMSKVNKNNSNKEAQITG